MPIAYNEQTGEALYLANGSWQPAKIASNPQTGERVAYDGSSWQPIGGKKPEAVAPEQPKSSTKERLAGIIAAPGFAATQLGKEAMQRSLPEQAVATGKAIGEGLSEGVGAWGEDVAKGGKSLAKAFSPNITPLHRAQLAGHALLKGVQGPFEVPLGVLGSTYGKLASEGSRAVTPTGEPLISKEEASIVPSLFIGGGKKPTEMGKAFENVGIDLKKATDTRGTAAGLIRDVPNVPETLAGKSGLAKSTGVPDVGLSDIGHTVYTDYLKAEQAKDQLYAKAEALAKGTAHDFDPVALDKITKEANQLVEEASLANASDDTKKAAELAKDFLNRIGKPYQEPPKYTRVEKSVGERVKTTTQDQQFPERKAETTDMRKPMSRVSGGSYAETEFGPRLSSTVQNEKTRTITSAPYTDVVERWKQAKNAPQRETLKSDVIAADKMLNDELRAMYAAGMPNRKMRDFATSAKQFIDKDLDRTAAAGDNFSRVYKDARESFQTLKRTYDTTAHGNELSFLKKLGLDMESLKSVKDQTGMLNPDIAGKLNKIPEALSTDVAKIGNELAALKGRISPDAYSKIVREKIKLVAADNKNLNYEKAVEARPMLARLFRESNLPPEQQHKLLNDYITTSKMLKDTGVSGSPKTPLPRSAASRAFNQLVNAASLATFGLVKSAAHAAGNTVLKALARGTEPENLYGLQKALYTEPSLVKGAAVGTAIQNTTKGNQ